MIGPIDFDKVVVVNSFCNRFSVSELIKLFLGTIGYKGRVCNCSCKAESTEIPDEDGFVESSVLVS